MSKIKSIYDKLKPELKDHLKSSARKYSTAKRLKYTLMSKMIWSELSIYEVRDILTYGDLNSWELDCYSFMYGEKIIKR